MGILSPGGGTWQYSVMRSAVIHSRVTRALGHIGFQHVQWLIYTGHLKLRVNSKAVDNYERPKCAACESLKGNCQPDKINTTKNNTTKEQEINKYHLLPGKMVSIDHYFLRDSCRLYHTKV